ncbi:MAG: ethanolamine ammonia-lyase reactivating factor EutA [Gemmataceae bacterium]
MHDAVNLLGLDFGTTTSGAVAARGRLLRNVVTGRMEVADVHETFRSDLVYTPLQDDRLDLARIDRYLDDWLGVANLEPGHIFGGGALLTGLTARRDNAAGLVERIKRRLANALVARAEDPCLESWLAFMGSAAPLSRELPERMVLNLDIGGGTTNIALGKAGEVQRVGCLFVGARHIEMTPETYRIVRLSSQARELFAALDIRKGPGDTLTDGDVKAVIDLYIALLEKVVGRVTRFDARASNLMYSSSSPFSRRMKVNALWLPSRAASAS